MNADDIQAARNRQGSKDPSRDEGIDDILSPQEQVGRQNELPLLSVDYDEYYRHEELYRPAARDQLEELVSHPIVGSVQDMAEEIGTTTENVSKALDLHGIDPPQGIAVEIEVDRITQLLGSGVPPNVVSPTNGYLVGSLYVDYGLSVEECADLLDGNPATVRQTLVDCYLLDGETTDMVENRRRQARGEVNSPHVGGRGITVNADEV